MTKTKGEKIDQNLDIFIVKICENLTGLLIQKSTLLAFSSNMRSELCFKIHFQLHRKGYENQRKEFYIRNSVQTIVVGFKQSGLSTELREDSRMGTGWKSF